MTERVVAFLGFEGSQLLDLSGPHEVFATANFYVAESRGLDPAEADPAYRIVITSVEGGEIGCFTGPKVVADVAVSDLDGEIDTLIVPGTPLYRERMADDAFQEALAGAASRARRTGAICTSAFQLGSIGLLDGRRATTHWMFIDELEATFPQAEVERFPIFVEDGPIFTSAGVTAGIDLALAMVEADHGPEITRQVAQYLVVFMQRPGGQAQFSARMSLEVTERSGLRELLDGIAAEPAADHSLAALSERAGYSERHLSRVFARELGSTPARFVEEIRIEGARALLESSDAPIEAIAASVGLQPEALRRAFVREVGVPPQSYRQRFRTTGVTRTG